MYLVETKTSCDADRAWLRKFRSQNICQECNKTFNWVYNNSIDINLDEHPGTAALNRACPPAVGIARCDFFELFADVTAGYLETGRVFMRDIQLKDYCTFTSASRLLIHGQEDVYSRVCPGCGRHCYWPGTLDKWYIPKSSITGQVIYESIIVNGLIITEDLRARIKPGRWKGVLITKLPVIDEARDGIEEIPKSLVF